MSPADWDRLQYYSRKVKFFEAFYDDDPVVDPSTYFRIAQLRSSVLFPSLRHLKYSLDDNSISRSYIFLFLSPLLDSLELCNIGGFENTIVAPFLVTLASESQMLSQLVLQSGQISVDILEKSVVHFTHLRSLKLLDAVFMGDFVLLEVLGALPSLANLTLKATDPASHPAHAPENSNSPWQSGAPKYFEALESLCVTGSIFLIQHLLGFIDSPCIKSLEIYPVFYLRKQDPDDLSTPSMTTSMKIVASKWSQSLKSLVIDSSTTTSNSDPLLAQRCAMLKSLILTAFNEMQTFHLKGWWIKNLNDDVRCLVMSWPKLKSLRVLPLTGNRRRPETFISFSTLRIIAENCPELRYLHIQLDISIVPPFDTSSKSLHHNLEVLTVGKALTDRTSLKCQIQVTRHLDSIFPYLKSIEVQPKGDVTWSGIRDLVHLCQDVSLRRVK